MSTIYISINTLNTRSEKGIGNIKFKQHCLHFKAPVLQILLENHELCKYAQISLHIHIIVDLNKNIGLNPHMSTVLLRKQTIRVSAIGIYLL